MALLLLIVRSSYYTASPEGSPHHRHLYRVRDDPDSQQRQVPECLTCQLTYLANETESEVALLLRRHHLQFKKKDGPLPTVQVQKGCLFNEVDFSPDLSYFAVSCKGPGLPRILLYQTRGKEQEEPQQEARAPFIDRG